MEPLEGFGFDLPDPFASQTEFQADFFQGVRGGIVQAEPHPKDGRLAGIEGSDELQGRFQNVMI